MRSENQIVPALSYLAAELFSDVEISPAKMTRREKIKYTIIFILGSFSGYLSWASSEAGGERYAVYFGDGIEYLACLGGGVTNALFNTESFLTLLTSIEAHFFVRPSRNLLVENSGRVTPSDSLDSLAPYVQRNSTSSMSSLLVPEVVQKDESPEIASISPSSKMDSQRAKKILTKKNYAVIEWCASFAISFFAVLPVWYQGSANQNSANPDNYTKIIMLYVSAVLNLFVNADGAKNLITWVKSYDLKDRFSELFISKDKRLKYVALRKARNIIVKQLTEEAAYFRHDEYSQRNELLNTLSSANGSELGRLLNSLHTSHHPQPFAWSPSSVLKQSTFTLLALALGWGNFGYAVDSWNGGLALLNNRAWAATCVIFNSLPGFGFCIKGLKTAHQAAISPLNSLAKMEKTTWYYGLCIMTFLFAMFSGFTADEMNYQGIFQVFNTDNTAGAIVSGVVSNIANVFAYNLPQCWLLVQRVIEIYLMIYADEAVKQQITFAQQIEDLAQTMVSMPMDVCEDFFDNPGKLKDDLKIFLRHALQRGEINSAEVDLIGLEYSGLNPQEYGRGCSESTSSSATSEEEEEESGEDIRAAGSCLRWCC